MNLAIASDVLKEMLATQFDEISMESLYKRNYPQAGLVDYYACVRTAMITDETHLAALYAASILDSADEEDIIAFLDHYESW